MAKLRSIQSPEVAKELSRASLNIRKILPGKPGLIPERGPNRAKESLIVKGKCGPLQPRRRVSMGSVITESVIGVDNRTRVLETDMTPWRMVCALRIVAPLGTFLGTGWLAGPATVITAGHCVYDAVQMGGWVDRIEVTPGLNGPEQPFPTMIATRFSTVAEWIDSRNPDFDYAAIHLPQPAGKDIGYFATGAMTDEDLRENRVNVSGYPGDRGNGVEQWFHQNRVLAATPNRLFYDVDTAGGQSGAPVWMYPEEGAEPVVVGIHAYGTGGTPGWLQITANSSPRITEDVLEQIVEWFVDDASRFDAVPPADPSPAAPGPAPADPKKCHPLSV